MVRTAMIYVKWISALHSAPVFTDIHGTEEPSLTISLERNEEQALDFFFFCLKNI